MRVTRVCFARPRRIRPHALSADFAPANEHPLSTSLHQRALENTINAKKVSEKLLLNVPHGRVNIVSPGLCDDVLNLISPSLEAYRGCELFDINPLSGLWSKKLYEHLQPSKYHVIERKSEADYYKTWAGDLLQQNNAISHHYEKRRTPLSPGIIASEFSKLVNIPEVEVLRELWGKPEAKTVIVSANCGGMQRPKAIDLENRSHVPARTIIRTLTETIRKDPEVFRGKKIKFLLWTNEEDLPYFHPRSLYWRRLLPLELNYDYEIRQLVTAAQFNPMADRPPWMNAQSAIWTGQRMLQSGQIHPSSRQDLLHQVVMSQLKLTSEDHSQDPPVRPQLQQDIDELLNHLQQLFRGEISPRETHSADKETGKRSYTSPAWARVIKILEDLYNLTSQQFPPIHMRGDQHKDSLAFLELHELELAIEAGKSCNEDTTDLESRAALLLQLIKAKDQQVGFTRKAFWAGKHTRTDNQLALSGPEPLFAWDRREFEPLFARLDEFWPRLPLALLDFELKDGVLDKPNPYLSPFIRAIMMNKQKTLTQTLDNLVLGAADGIIPNCPSITSPSHGGTFHPEYMSPLLLSDEMVAELQTAWDAYPFKIDDQALRMLDSTDLALSLEKGNGSADNDVFEK